ncbi:MAG: recombination protein O N-terminal domain-containing protein, partial [Muribaculaceae bacterium]|nr:recombination protein O N-terminal domain-containing protein [Muribaculaceae bacterium]
MPIERVTGIVTDIVRHNDRHNIVTLFRRSRGRVSFLSPAGSGKAGRARNARL